MNELQEMETEGLDSKTEAPCAICGQESDTLCDSCCKEVCYGCWDDLENLCVDCAI